MKPSETVCECSLKDGFKPLVRVMIGADEEFTRQELYFLRVLSRDCLFYGVKRQPRQEERK